jgi:hypothetical protein
MLSFVGDVAPTAWTAFERDGRSLEYVAVATKSKTRPQGWPANKPSPAPWEPIVLVIVRKPTAKTGPAMVYPEGTVVTVEHAIETARRFWAELG